MDYRSLLRSLLSPWVIGGGVLFALLLLAITAGAVWFSRPGPRPASPPTAVLNVIRAPTITPAPPTLPPTVQPSPTPPLPPAPEPGAIALEGYVQINGTGGEGLRLRADPGLKGDVRMLGAEAEVFQVKDGPVEADGFTWWYLEGPYDTSRRGWAVANYLVAVQAP